MSALQVCPAPWRAEAAPPSGHCEIQIVDRFGTTVCRVGGALSSSRGPDLAPLLAAAPDLLALARQYAMECGECAGTRVCPDDHACTECADIWSVINKAEGRS